MELTHDKFKMFWDDDWILRTLLVNHFVYWRGDRKKTADFNKLRNFITRHSSVHGKSEFENALRIYSTHSIFLEIDNPSEKSGYVNPESFEVISEVLLRDYNLEKEISTNYVVADFLWDVFVHPKNAEDKIVSIMGAMLSETFGFSQRTFKSEPKSNHKLLQLTWTNSDKLNVWWIAFSVGENLKREDEVAEGLITSAALNLRLAASTGERVDEQFWSLCGYEFGNTAVIASNQVNTSFDLETRFNLILLISIIKLITWGESNIGKKKEILANFSEFFSNQELGRPLSAKSGIENLSRLILKTNKKN